MVDLVKKNKFTIIVVVLFVLFMFLVSKAKDLFVPNEGKAVYGDRLVGKVEVDSKTYEELKTKLIENEKVESAEVKESGRLIYITITVSNDASLDEAKGTTNCIFDLFTEAQKGYYDFHVTVVKTDPAENNFPILGYKQHNRASFVWSLDRDKTDISS